MRWLPLVSLCPSPPLGSQGVGSGNLGLVPLSSVGCVRLLLSGAYKVSWSLIRLLWFICMFLSNYIVIESIIRHFVPTGCGAFVVVGFVDFFVLCWFLFNFPFFYCGIDWWSCEFKLLFKVYVTSWCWFWELTSVESSRLTRDSYYLFPSSFLMSSWWWEGSLLSFDWGVEALIKGFMSKVFIPGKEFLCIGCLFPPKLGFVLGKMEWFGVFCRIRLRKLCIFYGKKRRYLSFRSATTLLCFSLLWLSLSSIPLSLWFV